MQMTCARSHLGACLAPRSHLVLLRPRPALHASPASSPNIPSVLFPQCCGWMVYSLSRVLLLRPHGLQPARLLCSWDSPGKDPGPGCHVLLHPQC